MKRLESLITTTIKSTKTNVHLLWGTCKIIMVNCSGFVCVVPRIKQGTFTQF